MAILKYPKGFYRHLNAKQCWKLIHNPDSTWARVLKGLYFPHSSFLQASSSPRRSSWIWQSLLAGRDVIKEGYRHNIGDDTQSLIWFDPWIPSIKGFRVFRPPHFPLQVNLVADLIDHDLLQWKTNIIDSIFDPIIATAIKAIPVAPLGNKDSIVWRFDHSGNYSVKSGYRFLSRIRHDQSFGGVNNSNLISREVWLKTWNLPIQPKFKVFLWKALLNALPVKSTLLRRGIPINPSCPNCAAEEETIEHTLFWCNDARAKWFVSANTYKPNPVGFGSFSLWWSAILNEFCEDQLGLCFIAISCWIIWKERNLTVFDHIGPNPIVAAKRISKSFFEVSSSATRGDPITSSLHDFTVSSVWSPPPVGTLKLNSDVA
ncbi:uncharacterized protein LOC110661903 [Hevea brasiliensis]|uniref:uncharacterized protein LOC110661903 n=1 Tax=Hevea brasiliensis TaxID=3981 RepID=UPI0025EA14B1|nr:uncharacterized protein LOC110661903 [Hevea brasiliensis]